MHFFSRRRPRRRPRRCRGRAAHSLPLAAPAPLPVRLLVAATVYVNDAFGAAHRAHASTAGVASAPGVEHAVCGLLLEKELTFLSGAVLDAPKRPLVAIVGGSKVSTKLPVLKSLLGAADSLLVGGAMAFTFVKARGGSVGKSLVENEQLDLASDLVKQAKVRPPPHKGGLPTRHRPTRHRPTCAGCRCAAAATH